MHQCQKIHNIHTLSKSKIQQKELDYQYVYMQTVPGEAIEQAFQTYLKAKITATDNKIPLAPVDSGNGK